jgi:hypothetical protein
MLQDAGHGEYIVLDRASQAAFKVEVGYDPNQGGYGDSGGHSTVALSTPLPVNADDLLMLQRALDLQNAGSGWLKYNVVMTPDDPSYPGNIGQDHNAHDVIRDNGYREAIGRSLTASPLPPSQPNSLLRDVMDVSRWLIDRLSRMVNLEAISMVIRLQFPDESTADYRIDKNNTAAAKYVPGSARDKEGNVLPDESNARPGMPDQNNSLGIPQTFESSDTINEWLQSAAIYGIRVVDLNGLPRGPGSVTVGGGGTISCGVVNGAMECIYIAQ